MLRVRTGTGSTGTCFVIDAQRGLLWTCSHVVGQTLGSLVRIGMAPAELQPITWVYEAEVIFTTPAHSSGGLDGALLRITKRLDGSPLQPLTHADPSVGGLPALPLGDDHALTVGEPIIIIGYPGATGGTVTPTVGIYSNRKKYTPAGQFLLTDSNMLQGHSGGPGLNQQGEVIGWNVRHAEINVYSKVHPDKFDPDRTVPCGINELRPVRLMLDALASPAVATALGHQVLYTPIADYLTTQPGCILAGTWKFGSAAAREYAAQALGRANAAHAAAQVAQATAQGAAAMAMGAQVAATGALAAAGQANKAAEATQSMAPHFLRVASYEHAERDAQVKRKAADNAAGQADDAEALARQKRNAVLTANEGGPSCAAGTVPVQ